MAVLDEDGRCVREFGQEGSGHVELYFNDNLFIDQSTVVTKTINLYNNHNTQIRNSHKVVNIF